MTEKATKKSSSSHKCTTLFLDTLAVFLILFAPYLNFIIHNDVIFELANVTIITSFLMVSFLLALLFLYTESSVIKICIISILIILFIDVQFDFSQWWGWKVVVVILGIALLSWILRRHLTRIVSVAFGTIAVATAATPLLQVSFERGLGQENRIDGTDTGLPVYIHLILDEHIGTGGLESAVPLQKPLKREIEAFLLESGFRNFGRSYSRYYDSIHSISTAFNMNEEKNIRTLYSNTDSMFNFTLHANSYFSHLESKGYNINIYQTSYIDFCGSIKNNLQKCRTYHRFGMSSSAMAKMSVAEKTMVLISVYTKWSTFFYLTKSIYNTLRDDLDARGFNLPAWGNWDSMLSPLGALLLFDELIEDVSSASRGMLFFAHILIPHYPYALDSDCTIRRPITEWHTRSVKSPEERALYYAEYGEQVRCVKMKLVALMDALKRRGMFDDATIILHGDHGSRIGLVEPRTPNKARLSKQDYVDAFSTLFAIKAADIEPGYDQRMLPLPKLLHDAVAGGLGARSTARHSEMPFVFLIDPESGIFEKVPMPEFGATKHPDAGANQRDAGGPR